jgi:arginine/lysine/ornithine decarboxylase
MLNNRYHIQVEMADPFHVLVIVSIGDRRDDLNRLVEALREISKEYHGIAKPTALEGVGVPLFMNEATLTPREAFFADHHYVEVEKAIGCVSSEIVTVYPPGIPLLIPGEVITQEVLDYLMRMLKLGAFVDGLDEGNRLIGVVKR